MVGEIGLGHVPRPRKNIFGSIASKEFISLRHAASMAHLHEGSRHTYPHQIKKDPFGSSLIWWARKDLNLHALRH